MAHLTRRINIVNSLMTDAEYLEEVKGNMLKFNEMLKEFKSLQESYVQVLSEEDKVEDLKTWYEPRMNQVDMFVFNVEKWMSTIQEPDSQTSTQVSSALKVTDQLNDEDNISSHFKNLMYKSDLKRTIAVLLDDILNRLVKLEGKVEAAVNASVHNISHPAGGAGTLLAAKVTVSRPTKQNMPGHRPDRRNNPLHFLPQSPDRPHKSNSLK
ncbi:Coiled-coil domain-containing protein 126 [Anabarilius grahami]|uniref:Coiled-coil domain-containing protein 126 n=1 Tax=Anabarilius grahami TaxID=495550 RepID=A0A3N0YJ16_ANAGA|nr:Coiled-coil domain-containing protein 126 [Anabarilius grahami]